MTIQRSWGPTINVGVNPPLGNRFRPLTLGVASPPPYVSGVNENPDAGPETSFAGFMLRDFRIFSSPDGNIGLVPGGYPAQDFGFLMSAMGLTADFIPSRDDSDNIMEAQATHERAPMRLREEDRESTRVLRFPHRVPGFRHHVIPPGAIQIDEAPRYHGYGTSRALQAWIGNGIGRCLALHSTTNLISQEITIQGWDCYGFPITETINGPSSGVVHTNKAFKWVFAVIPSATNPHAALSIGTSSVFEFPLRADSFCDVLIWWNNNLITNSNGFTPADARFPVRPEFGSPRGTYHLQSAPNGTARLQIRQAVRAVNSDSVFGTFGAHHHEQDEFFWDSREGGPGFEDGLP